MNRGKFKFNAILRVLLLAGTVCTNDFPQENKSVSEKTFRNWNVRDGLQNKIHCHIRTETRCLRSFIIL